MAALEVIAQLDTPMLRLRFNAYQRVRHTMYFPIIFLVKLPVVLLPPLCSLESRPPEMDTPNPPNPPVMFPSKASRLKWFWTEDS